VSIKGFPRQLFVVTPGCEGEFAAFDKPDSIYPEDIYDDQDVAVYELKGLGKATVKVDIIKRKRIVLNKTKTDVIKHKKRKGNNQER
jgi:hypothetical protein